MRNTGLISSDTSRRLFILTAILMLLVSSNRPAFMLLLSQESAAPISLSINAEDENNSSETTILSSAYEAVIPVYKFQVAFFYSLIVEFELLEEVLDMADVDISLPQSDYFRILFRNFISPNAP